MPSIGNIYAPPKPALLVSYCEPKEKTLALKAEEVRIIRSLADKYKIPQDFALGITDKESAGRAMWRVGNEYLPPMRIEGHYFYARLSGTKRDMAVRLGLASPKAGAVKNPNDYKGRYDKLKLMADIAHDEAYQSISIGIGQVMGSHYKMYGYKSAYEMWKIACGGLVPQVEQMLLFISRQAKMYKAAVNYDYATFARLYNGPAYKKNRYDTDLKKFVEKWPKTDRGVPVKTAPEDTTPSEVQRILDLGYDTVREFQAARGIKVDGIIGQITRDELQAAEAERAAGASKPYKVGGAIAGGGAMAVGAGAIAEDAVNDIEKYSPIVNAVSTIAANGTTVAIGIGAVVLGVIAVMYVYKRLFK